MKKIKLFLAHLSISMAVGLVVLAVLDGRNPLMYFLTSAVSKTYIVILSCVCVCVAVLYIAQLHREE